MLQALFGPFSRLGWKTRGGARCEFWGPVLQGSNSRSDESVHDLAMKSSAMEGKDRKSTLDRQVSEEDERES